MTQITVGRNVRAIVAEPPGHLYIPFSEHQQQIAELEAENKRLREASDAFRARFNEWIMRQDEGVKLSTALAFGAEYENLLDA
jgi:hypothetical protein